MCIDTLLKEPSQFTDHRENDKHGGKNKGELKFNSPLVHSPRFPFSQDYGQSPY